MLKIGKLKIGNNYNPRIIAEISANHNQSLQKAITLIKKASKNGADFVKIQTYTPESLTLDSNKKDFNPGLNIYRYSNKKLNKEIHGF